MPNSIVFTGLFKTIGIMRIDTTSWFEQEFGGTKIKSLTTTDFKHNEIVLCLTSVTDDDSASRLLFSSTTIIEEQTAIKYLYDKSQTIPTTTADIADSTDKRYVTDAELTVIDNTSGVNTGDDAVNSLYSGLESSKQDTLVSGTNIKTINGTTILGSGDMTVGGQVDILQIQMFI